MITSKALSALVTRLLGFGSDRARLSKGSGVGVSDGIPSSLLIKSSGST